MKTKNLIKRIGRISVIIIGFNAAPGLFGAFLGNTAWQAVSAQAITETKLDIQNEIKIYCKEKGVDVACIQSVGDGTNDYYIKDFKGNLYIIFVDERGNIIGSDDNPIWFIQMTAQTQLTP